MTRIILLGRSNAMWPALHWAVKVGEIWYEIEGKGVDGGGSQNRVSCHTGSSALSGAGRFGGEIVGETLKNDEAIHEFIIEWLVKNPRYEVFGGNCQAFAYSLIVFLTDGVNIRLPHRFDAASLSSRFKFNLAVCSIRQEGMFLTRMGTGESRRSVGHCHGLYRGPWAELNTVSRGGWGGWGAWVGAVPLGRAELNMGPLVGVHAEPNLNTGCGVRDGNLDLHLAGFGLRVGADGLECNSPIGGFSLCTIS